MLELDGKLESLVTNEEELIDELEDDGEEGIKELDSAVEEDEDDSGINDDIDDDVDSLLIKLVLEMDGDTVDEGKGISHPVKINAKKGMANPMNRKAFSLCIQSI